MKKLLSLLLMLSLALFFVACGEDDDPVGPGDETTEAWVGTWLSAGADVAPILANPTTFNLDSVRVQFSSDNKVVLDQHVSGGQWSQKTGTYVITKTDGSDIHSIKLEYLEFTQEGIIQVTSGNPDSFKLEAIQTIPDYGFVPRTPETGFGSDPDWGVLNIQVYKKVN